MSNKIGCVASSLACVDSFSMTSKSILLNEKCGQVVVNVAAHATKPMVKLALESMFFLKVRSVRAINIKGAVARRTSRKTPDRRKMVVSIDGSFSVSDMLAGE